MIVSCPKDQNEHDEHSNCGYGDDPDTYFNNENEDLPNVLHQEMMSQLE